MEVHELAGTEWQQMNGNGGPEGPRSRQGPCDLRGLHLGRRLGAGTRARTMSFKRFFWEGKKSGPGSLWQLDL